MYNFLDYLKNNQKTFKENPFNDVDSLVFAYLSYLHFPNIKIKLKELDITTAASTNKNKEFIKNIILSNRYKNIEVYFFVEDTNDLLEKQFSAVTFLLPNNTMYLSFRGTDSTLTGWKEDFLMACMPEVPSQEEAVLYTERVAEQYPNHRLLLGGHSKGGNLAVYAAVQASPEIQSRIDIVWSNDGPGFQEAFLRSEAYQALSPKIRSIVPKSSVVGMLLAHPENYQIVDSSQIGLLQHDGLSWQIMGDHFIILPELTHESIRTERTIRSWLQKIPQEEREEFVDSLFSVLYSTGAHTLSEIRKDRMKAAAASIPALKELPKENRDRILEFVMLLNLISKRLNDESKAVRTERIQDEVPAFSQRSKKRKKSRATIPLSTET